MLSGVQALAMSSSSKIVGNKAIDDADLVDALKAGTLSFEGYNGNTYTIGSDAVSYTHLSILLASQ